MSTVRENAVLFAGDTVFAAEAECYIPLMAGVITLCRQSM